MKTRSKGGRPGLRERRDYERRGEGSGMGWRGKGDKGRRIEHGL